MKILNGRLRFAGVVTAAIVLIFAFTACGDEEKKSDAGQPAPAAGNGAATADACKLVTQEDASQLFGKPASPEESGAFVIDPNMVSECLWTWDSPEADNQLLQFRIWNGEMYYSEPSDSYTQTLDIGDKGNIRVHKTAGVDIQWVQDGKTIDLSYSTVGTGVPDPTTKVEEVKALARKVEKEL